MKITERRCSWKLWSGSVIAVGLCFAFVSITLVDAVAADRLNVLFIAVDDLRPALGCYGDELAITPNIDRLAKRGTVFRRAYCQQAVCSPSRLSLLTGRRPDTIRVWDLRTHFRAALPDVVTLPQHFRLHGYHTESLGKIYHGSGPPAKDPPSWSVEPRFDYVRDPKLRYALEKNRQGKGLKRASTEQAAVADNVYIDGIVCDAAIRTLTRLSQKQRPFFLAVGFRKPHLPFSAPKKYWELYDRAHIKPPSPDAAPANAPELATRSWRELEGYTDIPADGRLEQDQVRELRHGYYACVSYVDALVGRLLASLDELKLRNKTLVVLWGDHGFHLGEQGLWTKANNYELATRVPLIVSLPGQKSRGSKCDRLVELVDLYPTLAELCELPEPEAVEGLSFQLLIADPQRRWKQAAFSQFPRPRTGNRHRGQGDIMGYAIRTPAFRYVEWRRNKSQEVIAGELYDHRTDPHESANIVAKPEYRETVQRLSEMLAGGWRAVQPN